MPKIKAGIAGGAGYTGGELIRILINHPSVEIVFAHSRSNANKPVYAIHQDLAGETDLQFAANISTDIDVLFLCVGHGESKQFFEEFSLPDHVRVIDLSQDFRLNDKATAGKREFIYGLPELNRSRIRTASNIANPGCFATAIQLGLLPLAQKGILSKVYSTGITGSTGAGQSLSSTSHFSWRANNIQPYKTLTHQHIKEIGQSLRSLQSQGEIQVNFVPWRGDFTRGIFISSQVETDLAIEEIVDLYAGFYKNDPFTFVTIDPIFLKQVVNTNKCMIQIEKIGNTLVVHSAIDNLLKGASGQAVQNMNLMFSLEETEGLNLKANYF